MSGNFQNTDLSSWLDLFLSICLFQRGQVFAANPTMPLGDP